MRKLPVAFTLLVVALVGVFAVPTAWAQGLDTFEKEVRKDDRAVQRQLKDAERDDADERREDEHKRRALRATRHASGDDLDLDLDSDDVDKDLD